MSLRIPTENLACPVVPFVRMVKGRGANFRHGAQRPLPHLSTSIPHHYTLNALPGHSGINICACKLTQGP